MASLLILYYRLRKNASEKVKKFIFFEIFLFFPLKYVVFVKELCEFNSYFFKITFLLFFFILPYATKKRKNVVFIDIGQKMDYNNSGKGNEKYAENENCFA